MKEKVGFIGTGVMGLSMAMHLLKAGHKIHIFNRTQAKASPLLENGATWEKSPEDLAKNVDTVISIVGFPEDVEAIYLGDSGIINSAKPGSLLIDMTTSKPDLAKRIFQASKEKGIQSLDAPVSGGDVGARNGTLSIMAGGEKEAFEKAIPLFNILGKNIVFQGPAGSGQHTKMCNQIAIASGMLGVFEAMKYAKDAGLNTNTVLKSIESGAAASWSLSNLAPRAMSEDYSPGFYVKHFIKDMGIALEAAEEMNLHLPGLALAKKLYDTLAANEGNEQGTQAIYRVYAENLLTASDGHPL